MGFELTTLVVIGTVVVNQTTIRSRPHRNIHRLDNAQFVSNQKESLYVALYNFTLLKHFQIYINPYKFT